MTGRGLRRHAGSPARHMCHIKSQTSPTAPSWAHGLRLQDSGKRLTERKTGRRCIPTRRGAGQKRPHSGLPAGPGHADAIVQRAEVRRIVGREDGVAAPDLADASAPVGRDPVADLAEAWDEKRARDARLHERDRAGQRQSMGGPFRRPTHSTPIFVGKPACASATLTGRAKTGRRLRRAHVPQRDAAHAGGGRGEDRRGLRKAG
jgi:hypothetical protein